MSKKGDQIVAGSADMTLKVVNRETFKDVLLEGHTAPVLSVAFNPAADHVVSSSCDGSVRLWNVAEKRCVEKWEQLWKESNDVTASVTRGGVAFNPMKNEFSVPVKDVVKVVIQGKGEEFKDDIFTTTTALPDGEIMSTTAWSNDGKMLSAGTSKGRVLIWKRVDKSLVGSFQSPRQYEIW